MSEQIVDVLTHLAMVTKGQEVDPAKFLAYALELQDIPFEELAYVCQGLGRSEEWFPALAVIRKAWADAVMAPGPTEGQAIAWMIDQVNAIGGPYPSSHPVLAEMVRIYPFSRLSESEDNDFTRRDLAKAYQQARASVAKQVMAGELAPPPLALPESSRPALKAVS